MGLWRGGFGFGGGGGGDVAHSAYSKLYFMNEFILFRF